MTDPTQKSDVWQGTMALMVLKTLEAMGPLHGYGIARRIEQVSNGTLSLNQGTIYPALHRLERAGLLQSGWSTASGHRRRIYQLTARGKRAAASARGDWRRFSAAVEAVLA